jgi:2'-5' RNA ligase
MRIFVAIELEPPIKQALEDVVRKLKRTGADVRWVDGRGMHLTLKFLGEIAEAEVPSIEQAVKDATSAHGRFPLILRGTGTFPSGKSPRVLWVGVTEEAGLMELQKAVEARLEAAGYPREGRPFHPHLTLGRVKSPSRLGEALAQLEKCRETVFGEMTAAKIALVESRLGPHGAEYRVVSEFALG